MVEVTEGWTPEEREAFCTLLTRFNTALSARQSAHTGQAPAESGGADGITGGITGGATGEVTGGGEPDPAS